MKYLFGKNFVLTLLVLCGGTFVGTGMAMAQALDLDKINKIPRYSKMTEQEFEAKSTLFTEIPDGDKKLEYTVRLPKGWQKLGLSEEEKAAAKQKAESEAVVPQPSNPYDISHLRDQALADEKNNITRNEEGDGETGLFDEEDIRQLENGRLMVSKYTLSRRSRAIDEMGDINLLGPVAKFIGPANLVALSRLEIYATKLSQDVTTRNWFLNYIISQNYTLTGMEQIDDQRIDAEYILIEKGLSYVVRTAAIANGPRMILVSYYVPEKFWDKEKEMQQATLDSFQFVRPEKTVVNNKKTHGFLDLVKFDYPQNWRLIAPNVYTVDTMSARLLSTSDAKQLNGEMNINVVSTELDTNLMKEVELIRQDIKKRGFVTGAALDTNATYHFSDKITFNRVEAYEVAGNKKTYIDYEFWLGIMVEDRYYYIVTMITPGRKADFYTWARNTESFATVIQSMMPQAAGETLDATFLKKTTGLDSGGAAVAPGQ